jgi:hypothetical protein
VKRTLFFGVVGMAALVSAPAPAQDFTAGKTPAQLFSSDCAECHRTPGGLAKGRDARALAGFLREHYTTKSDTAGSLAAYVAGFADRGRNAVPANAAGERQGLGDRRARRDEGGPSGPSDESSTRRRRESNISGDGEKPRSRTDGAEPPRPPANIAPPSADAAREAARMRANPRGLNDYARSGDGAGRETTDPVSRLRAYVTSGLDYEAIAAEAAKVRPAKSRKRKEPDSRDTAVAPESVPLPKTGGDLPVPLPEKTGEPPVLPSVKAGGDLPAIPVPAPDAPAPTPGASSSAAAPAAARSSQ